VSDEPIEGVMAPDVHYFVQERGALVMLDSCAKCGGYEDDELIHWPRY
jgi:hypothetical protein